MHCLVYQSKAKLTFGRLQIDEMLEKSRAYNKKHQITGCLLFYHGDFIQYLEGSQNKLLELFSKIENDERHEFVTLLSFEEIMAREFEDWKMAFEDFSGDNHQLHYLKLLVAVFMEDDNGLVLPNPTSGKFWNATKLLLERKMGKGEWL